MRLGTLMQEVLLRICSVEKAKKEVLNEINPSQSEAITSGFYRACRILQEQKLIKNRKSRKNNKKEFISITENGKKVLSSKRLEKGPFLEKQQEKTHIAKIWIPKSSDFEQLKLRFQIIPAEKEIKEVSEYTPMRKIITTLRFLNRENTEITNFDDISFRILALVNFKEEKNVFLRECKFSLSSSALGLEPDEIMKLLDHDHKITNDLFYYRAILWRILQTGKNMKDIKNKKHRKNINKLYKSLLLGDTASIKFNYYIKYQQNGDYWLKKLVHFCSFSPASYQYNTELLKLDKKFISFVAEILPVQYSRALKNINHEENELKSFLSRDKV